MSMVNQQLIKEVKVIKKNGDLQDFKIEKIIDAVGKSADRAMVTYTNNKKRRLANSVIEIINRICEDSEEEIVEIPIAKMHNIVEKAAEVMDPEVAKSYRDFRDYKTTFVEMINQVYAKSNEMMFLGDRENANSDSSMVSTQRALEEGYLSKELYRRFFLTAEERKASDEGYIKIHDMSARRNTSNCCLFDVDSVLDGGFEMGNIWYNEPKSLDVAFDVIGDIVLSAASQQYGGFTVPEVDKILAKYAQKTYDSTYAKAYGKYMKAGVIKEKAAELADVDAVEQVEIEMKQGYQGWEYKFNTVASSRGDYPFITITLGLATDRWGKMAAKTILKTHREGQGKKGQKKPVLFPKIVCFYTEELHGIGKINEDVFEEGILTSAKTMYPDWLSLDGPTHLAEAYHKYGKAISPMGCRAFLSPWYERGGMEPADESDTPVFTGRSNIGVVTLHLPMILAKSRRDNVDFYEVLDYYLEIARKLHIRTMKYLGNMKASINPLGFCQSGFHGGNLGLDDKIAPVIKSWTASFGFTALNELQQLYDGRSLAKASREYLRRCEEMKVEEIEGDMFCLDVLRYLDQYLTRIKKEDDILYALYGTPAESLCGDQVTQFLKEFGPDDAVTAFPYTANSFHCHVTEDITPIEKQNLERPFWKYPKGGRIQYVKYPIDYNIVAIKTLVRRAMSFGYYEGVNLSLSYCNSCGHQELEMDTCPCCGSDDLTKIERMNGYLSYSRVHGKTRLNDAKMAEVADRKSM